MRALFANHDSQFDGPPVVKGADVRIAKPDQVHQPAGSLPRRRPYRSRAVLPVELYPSLSGVVTQLLLKAPNSGTYAFVIDLFESHVIVGFYGGLWFLVLDGGGGW